MTPSPPFQFAGGLATGLTGGVLSGLSGVGGGFILLPMLRLLLGVHQRQAQGVTLAAMMLPISLPALAHYHRKGVPFHWGLVGALILGFLPGVWAGAEGAELMAEGVLRWVFVGFLLLLSVWTAFPVHGHPPGESRPDCLWKGGLIGLVGGLCSGLLGIGGGVVMIPLLLVWLRMPQLQAQLLSLTVMVPPIRLPGLLVYVEGAGRFPWAIFLGLVAGFALGTWLGARLALAIPLPRLRGALVGLMLVTAGLLVWRG